MSVLGMTYVTVPFASILDTHSRARKNRNPGLLDDQVRVLSGANRISDGVQFGLVARHVRVAEPEYVRALWPPCSEIDCGNCRVTARSALDVVRVWGSSQVVDVHVIESELFAHVVIDDQILVHVMLFRVSLRRFIDVLGVLDFPGVGARDFDLVDRRVHLTELVLDEPLNPCFDIVRVLVHALHSVHRCDEIVKLVARLA